jgi:hypothetical protein
MAEPADLYVKGIRKQFNNYFATWLPSTQHELGDVGIFKDNLFIRVTSLEKLGISFKKREDKSVTSSINCVSTTGVKKTTKAAAEINLSIPALPVGKAGIELEFDKKGSYIFEAEGSYESSIEDLNQVEIDIRKVFEDGKWRAGWFVISNIVHTPNASIIISNSSNSKLVLSIAGDIPIAGIKLGDASSSFSVVSESGSTVRLLNAKNLTPFFQVHQLEAKPFAQIQDFLSEVLDLKDFIESKIRPIEVITPSLAKTSTEISKSLFLRQIDKL